HPYKWPVIGYMSDLNAATMKDIKDFYRIHYAPNNAVVVVAGAVNTGKVKSLIEKYYGGIEAQELPKKVYRQEPKQMGQRTLNLTKQVQAPIFAVMYRAAQAGQVDAYTMDLLSNILSNGNSSRLYSRLVYRSQLTSSISTYNFTPQEPGIFQVTGVMKPGVDMEKALTAVYGELYRIRKELVSEKELEKAKNQVMFDYVSSLKTVAGKAQAMAVNEIIHRDYSELFKDLEKYQAVTREDIKKAAETYLMPEQRSVIRVRPVQKEGV
ncbi:MAG: insulinase family protein, partial [Bdellovibrionales bacterium]|nr:insulinase family protein [Bdellovibrionales bacterium]